MIRRNTATNFIKNIQYLLLQYFPLTSREMPKMSRHCRIEYCAFAQYCRSKETNLLDKRVLTCFVIDSSELSLVIASNKLRASFRTLLLASLLASSSLLSWDKTIGIRYCLRSLSSQSLVYDAMIQLVKLLKKKLQVDK